MKNNLFLTTILLFILAASSCKKSTTTPDNPDVSSRLIDSVSVAPSGNGRRETAVDADNDGITDFYIIAINDNGAFTTGLDAKQVRGETNFTTDGIDAAADLGNSALIDSVSVPKGPRPPKAEWLNYGNCSVINGLFVKGFAGVGDIYIGFFIKLTDGRHYGWLKLNIPADGKSIKLISLGYQLKPRTAINAGEL